MSLHKRFKKMHASLEALQIQGRALLSCEDIAEEQVQSYKDLVDTVLEGSEMSLDDLSAAAATKAQELAGDTPTPPEQAVVATESEKSDDDDDIKLPDDETAPAADVEEEPTPREELEEAVEQVDHVVEKVSTFISHTEDSGLTTDDVQAMATVQETFESFANLQVAIKVATKSRSSRTISALTVLHNVMLRNLSTL